MRASIYFIAPRIPFLIDEMKSHAGQSDPSEVGLGSGSADVPADWGARDGQQDGSGVYALTGALAVLLHPRRPAAIPVPLIGRNDGLLGRRVAP